MEFSCCIRAFSLRHLLRHLCLLGYYFPTRGFAAHYAHPSVVFIIDDEIQFFARYDKVSTIATGQNRVRESVMFRKYFINPLPTSRYALCEGGTILTGARKQRTAR
jgi:hypothetical protein